MQDLGLIELDPINSVENYIHSSGSLEKLKHCSNLAFYKIAKFILKYEGKATKDFLILREYTEKTLSKIEYLSYDMKQNLIEDYLHKCKVLKIYKYKTAAIIAKILNLHGISSLINVKITTNPQYFSNKYIIDILY